MKTPVDFVVGDVIELRKPHPCGGKVWRVLRVGLDMGVECTTCQRYVLVPRSRLENRLKRFITRYAGNDDDGKRRYDERVSG